MKVILDRNCGVEAKNKLSWLLDRVEQGEEIVITRQGRPVARMVPANAGVDRGEARAVAQRMRDRARQSRLGAYDWETLKADRDTPRP